MDIINQIGKMQRDVDNISLNIAKATGEYESVDKRRDELNLSVGLAKGRINLKKNVEEFIEEMQSEAHAKRVGDFEQLLTALVSEVLPGESPIGLELDIERGQPSLDIVSRVSADLCEDIFEDQGGALTNIVVLGLRMISVVRSGMSKFLVLDEPDCWVKDDRIPAFYSIVKEAARKVGVQCFVISHHDTSKFADGISITSVHGRPDTPEGVMVENNPTPHVWSDDEDGFRFIRLVNFQGYVDEVINLYPGANALIGDNNIGKSSFVRAFRAVFYADVRDSLIRRGEKQCIVEIGLKNGEVIQFTRPLKKSPNWKLIDQNGNLISEDYDTSARKTPDWVIKKTGIGPIAGLDPHVVKQKTPIFLLDKPGSTRAAVLSIGQEAAHMGEMVGMYKKVCSEDSTTIKQGELEMFRLGDRAKALLKVLDLSERLNELKSMVLECSEMIEFNDSARIIMSNISSIDSRREMLSKKVGVLKDVSSFSEMQDLLTGMKETSAILPLIDRAEKAKQDALKCRSVISGISSLIEVPSLVSSEDIISLGKATKEKLVEISKLKQIVAALSNIGQVPKLTDVSSVNSAVRSVEKHVSLVEQSKINLDTIKKQVSKCHEELTATLNDIGDICPLCGGSADHKIILTSNTGE